MSNDVAIVAVVFAAIAIAAVVIVLVVMSLRARRAKRDEAESSLQALQRRAGAALVQADEQLRASEDELAFVAAGFGTEQTAPFSEAATGARRRLQEAFKLQQKLDDDIPDTDTERYEWSTRIVELCAESERELAQHSSAFAELRTLESRVPAELAALHTAIPEIERQIEHAQANVDRLEQTYSAVAVASIRANVHQAGELVVFMKRTASSAQSRVSTQRVIAAAAPLHAGQEALQRARALLASIDGLESDLLQAALTLNDMLSTAQDRLTQSRSEVVPDAQSRAAITHAQDTLAALVAQVREAAPSRDPLGDVDRIRGALAALDAALELVVQQKDEERRLWDLVETARFSADQHIRMAEDFIAAQRGTAGPEPRTRLTEANRALSMSRAEKGPHVALENANRAGELAQRALDAARRDAHEQQPTWSSSPGQWQNRSSDGDDIARVIGGTIAGVALGGLLNKGWGQGSWDLGDLFD